MNPYIYLGGAILAEVIGTTLMKFSEGFTRLWPSVGTIICYCASFWLLAQTLAGFAPIFPDICYHLTHYRPAAADIP
ncbi:SMR family transporter, partial [Escherichia coli]